MARYPFAVALAILLSGCQIASTPVAAPIVSANPHTAATAAALGQADVAAGLQPCAGSGPMAGYVAGLGTVNPALATKVAAEWKALRKAGAVDGAVTLYAADAGACSAEMAASGATKSEAGIVIAFADPGQADRAWQAGIFGFAPPAPGDSPPGVARGKSTGLGDTAWTYTNAPIQLACWRKSVFVAVVIVANLDAATFKAATAAVDARLN